MSEPRHPICNGYLPAHFFAAFHARDHPRAQGLVRERIDNDKSAGHAVRRVGIEIKRVMSLDRNLPKSSFSSSRDAPTPLKRVHIEPVINPAHQPAHLMRCVLYEITASGLQSLRIHPHAGSTKTAGHVWHGRGRDNQIPAADVDLIRQAKRNRLRSGCRFQIAIVKVTILVMREERRARAPLLLPP